MPVTVSGRPIGKQVHLGLTAPCFFLGFASHLGLYSVDAMGALKTMVLTKQSFMIF